MTAGHDRRWPSTTAVEKPDDHGCSLPTVDNRWSRFRVHHDAQYAQYEGPDADYQGRSLCFSSNATFDGTPFLNTLSFVDVTDPSNPVGIAEVEYPNDGYSHQGWLTPDQAYFLHSDELDELFFGVNTTTRVFDLHDLDNPVLTSVVAHDTTAIGHNTYTEGRYMERLPVLQPEGRGGSHQHGPRPVHTPAQARQERQLDTTQTRRPDPHMSVGPAS